MNVQKRAGFIMLAWAMLVVFGCIEGDTSSGVTEEEVTHIIEDEPDEGEGEDAPLEVGVVGTEINVVALGRTANSLVPLDGSDSFFEGDVIQVREGGLAFLSFGDRATVYLFNDSGVIIGEVNEAETSVENRIVLESMEGGLVGTLNEGQGPFVARTPGGAEITITGTDFFLVYDSAAQYTATGNFSGSITYEGDVTSPNSLAPGHFVIIPDNATASQGIVQDWLDGNGTIMLELEEFLELAVSGGSALDTFRMMLEQNVNRCPDASCFNDDVFVVTCGDALCSTDFGEDTETCVLDCGFCGDGLCSDELDERATCSTDCGPF